MVRETTSLLLTSTPYPNNYVSNNDEGDKQRDQAKKLESEIEIALINFH